VMGSSRRRQMRRVRRRCDERVQAGRLFLFIVWGWGHIGPGPAQNVSK
jgi:hypothetical protein